MTPTSTVFLDQTETTVSETDGVVHAKIDRTGSLDGDVVVTYGVTSDTATDGLDFIGGTHTATIGSGESSVTVDVPILNDTLAEGTENFVISAINVEGAALFAPRTERVHVLDDEAPSPPVTEEVSQTSNYTVTTDPLVSDLNQPLRFIFSPVDDNKIYIAEKSGVIKLADITTGESTTVLDIHNQINEHGDRGLLSIVAHPDFVNNPYIYAFEVVDPAGSAAAGSGDYYAGPDGAGNRYSQVVRYTADASTGYSTLVPGSAKVIMGAGASDLKDISGGGHVDFTDPANSGYQASDRYIASGTNPTVINGFKQDFMKADSSSHNGGDMAFGPDGMLYISSGEATSFNYADPRAADVQYLDNYDGKILRVDPDTGMGLADNPFVTADTALDSDRAKIYQTGLRNPFAITFDHDGKLFITDTGWDSYEEINTGGPGADFGWPFYEGSAGGVNLQTPVWKNMPGAKAIYDAAANGEHVTTAAFRSFPHDPANPGIPMQAITGGDAVIEGGNYPASLQGDMLFSDFSNARVYAVNTNDRSDLKLVANWDGVYAPIHYIQGPDGNLYYADLVSGQIGRLGITENTGGTGSATGPTTTEYGTGPDTLVLKVSEDEYQGDAQFKVFVDGQQLSTFFTAHASHAAGESDTLALHGNWAAGEHKLELSYLHDSAGNQPGQDRNFYLDGASVNGVADPALKANFYWASAQDFTFTTTGQVAPVVTTPVVPGNPGVAAAINIGTGPDTVTLKVSQDAFQDDAQFNVYVDGQKYGDVLTAKALHGTGAEDSIAIHGTWAPGAHVVTLDFLNDTYGGAPGTDRNLHLDQVSSNGVVSPDAHGDLLWSGPQNFAFTVPTPPAAPVAASVGTGADTLVLHFNQDAYNGEAQYSVELDGKPVGGVLTAHAIHGTDQEDTLTIHGDIGLGAHSLKVNFLNDSWGGTTATDRNLYLSSGTVNGEDAHLNADFFSGGPKLLSFDAPLAQTVGTGADKLVFHISQDAFQGNAQYTVAVDGKQVGGVLTADASHAAGEHDILTVQADLGTGPHTVQVAFLNDTWLGSAATDRNLYVDSVSVNGVDSHLSASLLNSAPHDFML